ncbi:PilZ domain-containing protein [Sphingomonas sp.]|jgi:hypothetical protein|uniref:PilZ domain-containing protein n=1 Tax=Sphingomonas sp. TaxID=28214 RepID=UPI0025FE0AE7|nr:PilZ domain-containing protein [Sphingomonas sp.]
MDQLSADRFDHIDEEPGSVRHQLRESMFLGARFRVPGVREPVDGRVRNISAGGLMAELPRPVEAGAAVEIEIRGIGWVAGKVAWAAHGRLGIAFDEPVDPQRARKPVTGTKAGPAPVAYMPRR